jgi:hypothetical protein
MSGIGDGRQPLSVKWLFVGAVTTLALLNIALGFVVIRKDGGGASVPAHSSSLLQSAEPRSRPSRDPQSRPGHRVLLSHLAYVVGPRETVRVAGRVPEAGDARRRVRVELWRRGAWSVFPVPAVTGPDGRFSVYVDLGEVGTHRLRVITSRSGPVSDPFTVTVR